MLVPAILSGGAGTRLWPMSREGHPKPFMKLPDGESLLLKTYNRAASVMEVVGDHAGEILTVTNRDYFFVTKDEFGKAQLNNQTKGVFLLEPMGRNTAAAVAMAALSVRERHGRDACLLILPADHLVQHQQPFEQAVMSAFSLAKDGFLVTFGVRPSAPETGFGYLESGDAQGEGLRVKRFVEKPSLELAKQYLESGQYYWNSGMFCFQAGVILEELERHAPAVFSAAFACWQNIASTESMTELPEALFTLVPDISIDYAVMERSDNVVMVPADIGWSDIGSWSAVSELVTPDANNNRVVGNAILMDTHNTFVQSDARLVAVVGVDDLMIIDTPDALLVSHADKAQDVKRVAMQLKLQKHDAYKLHRTVVRPWGSYTVLESGPGFKIKRIEVKPGASLSLQMHYHRSEHWVVVSGVAKVINGDRELLVNTNESTFIPAGHQHRLENPGLLDLVMIEVQSGSYLEEDDIVRFQDSYGRVLNKNDFIKNT